MDDMDELLRKLTDPMYIDDELANLIQEDEKFLHSIVEKYVHGESISIDKVLGKAIINKIKTIKDDPKQNLIILSLSIESLRRVITVLMAENNKRLVSLISHISRQVIKYNG